MNDAALLECDAWEWLVERRKPSPEPIAPARTTFELLQDIERLPPGGYLHVKVSSIHRLWRYQPQRFITEFLPKAFKAEYNDQHHTIVVRRK